MYNYQLLKIKKQNIETLLSNEDYKKAKEELYHYKKEFPYDLDISSFESFIYCMNGNYDKALQTLLEKYPKNEFNAELNFNIAFTLCNKNQFAEAAIFLTKAILLDTQKKLKTDELLNDISEHIPADLLSKIQHKISLDFSNYAIHFPKGLKLDNTEYRIKQFTYNNTNYYCGIYDYYLTERDRVEIDETPVLIPFNKYEIMQYSTTNSYDTTTDSSTLFPILVNTDKQIVNIKVNTKEYQLKELLSERFYYYKVPANSNVQIYSDNNFILGKKIELKKDKTLPSLILNIFVDGLSQKYLNDNNNLEKLAPNIYNFFKKGTICTNAHTTGEWTYTSIASLFTGMYTSEHRIFHPTYTTKNLLNYELYSEILQKAGFNCTKIDADYRSSPAIGYMKGFDRYLYQMSSRGMFVNDVITETIENISAFSETNNFMHICIPDLHDIADLCEEPLSCQTHTSLKNRMLNRDNNVSTVRKKYDPKLIERYESQLKRIDTYLGLLFNYIEQNFNDDEILISLFSDHGQGFLISSNEFLDEQRSNIAMMFRGKNAPNGTCTELISILDYFPIIFNSIGINDYNIKSSILPKYFGGNSSREYTYTESLHADFPYYAVINDSKYKFFFKTNTPNTNDGRIHINSEEDFTYSLINKITNKDETNHNLELVNHYIDIVLNHIQEYIII